MAEPVIEIQANEGSEGTPTWVAVDVALRWVGAGAAQESLDVPFAAPILDGDDAFCDNAAAPNDGDLWHEKTGATNDLLVIGFGRNTNLNVLRVEETGAADGTSDPPVFTAYDDATDAANRTNPTVWVLVGTAGSSSISQIRAVETDGAPAAGWTGQAHDAAPGGGTSGEALDGDQTGEKTTFSTILAASGVQTLNVAACAPHDATSGLTSFVYALTYTFE